MKLAKDYPIRLVCQLLHRAKGDDLLAGFEELAQLVEVPAAQQYDEFPDVPKWKDFSPRIGGAWDIFGTGKTVLRAGYGIYYNLRIMVSRTAGCIQPLQKITDRYLEKLDIRLCCNSVKQNRTFSGLCLYFWASQDPFASRVNPA